jgi:hypothetical protein
MNILQIAKQCCMRTQDPIMDSLFVGHDNAYEWQGYLSQAAKEVYSDFDWRELRKDHVLITDAEFKEWALPGDFDGMATYYLYNMTNQRLIPLERDDQALAREAIKIRSQTMIMYRIMGDKIVFTYPIIAGQEIKFTYKSKYFIRYQKDELSDWVYRDFFENDADEFLLDAELLIRKAIALRSINLGFPDAAAKEAAYQSYLEKRKIANAPVGKYNKFSYNPFNKTTPVTWSVIAMGEK